MRRAAPWVAAVLMTALPVGACAREPDNLRLVHADAFSILFLPDAGAHRQRLDTPAQVRTITFFETPTQLGQGSEWDTRISVVRVDCDTGTIGNLRHQTLLGEVVVGEVTPPFRMRKPNGPEQAAVLTYLCQPDAETSQIIAADMAEARVWAMAAYAAMPDHRR